MSMKRGKKAYIIIGMTVFMLIFCAVALILPEMLRPEVKLSHTAGFYDEAFFLSMEGSRGKIYYTLDGSRPDENSILYENPIEIGDASENDNVHSLREDLSPTYDHELLHSRDANSSEDYVVPDHKIDKCTIVRAVCINPVGGRSEERCASYFVGFQNKTGYENVSVLSVYSEPESFFGYEKGIYVTGKVMDDYLASGEHVDNDHFWHWWPANYRMSGSEWEREAVCELFDIDREHEFTKNIGVRIQGGGSRGYVPKSLNLYARDKYDGEAVFSSDIFNSGYKAPVITLFAGGDSRFTKLDDYLPQTLCADMNFATMDMRPCVLFLDGEYWGYYFITEHYDENYFAFHYGVQPENVVFIKNGELKCGGEKQLKVFNEDIELLKRADMNSEVGYEQVKARFDMDSLLDYYAVQMYLNRRNDWPYSNIAYWRVSKTEKGNQYADGRWRMVLFDTNSGCYGEKVYDADTILNTCDADPIFDNMMKSEVFKSELISRMKLFAQGRFKYERVNKFVEEYREFVTPLMMKEFDRFYGERRDYRKKLGEFIDRFNVFFEGREMYIEQY